MLESLPERPLTNAEAEHLKEQTQGIVPLSVLKGKESPYVIYTMAMYRTEVNSVHLLGYSDDKEGWVKIESFPEEEWSVEKQEETLQRWTDEHYGDEFKQGRLNDETNEVEMGF